MLTLRGSGSSECKRAATIPRLRNNNDEEELGDNTALPTTEVQTFAKTI